VTSDPFTESVVELAALAWLEEFGYQILEGEVIAHDGPAPERASYADVCLADRLRLALARLNPGMPAEALDDAFRKLTRVTGPTLVERNRLVHKMLVEGVDVEFRREDGSIAGDRARVLDFDVAANNDWLAVNQFTVTEDRHHRRPDIVLFVNGLPLGVIELKNAADEDATVVSAFKQIQTYKAEIPALFTFNETVVVSDAMEARVGTLTSDWSRFGPWRVLDGAPPGGATTELEVLVRSVFAPAQFLDLIRHFIVFEDAGAGDIAKKMAGYHQVEAVNVALAETRRATTGDRRIGVVWHTQGSGKSLTMAFYAGRLIADPAMANPTVVVLTDRNDLDDQLFATFSRCQNLLRQEPVQTDSRDDLRGKLNVSAGGVVFTTIQKFFPEEKGDRHPVLSDRRNIVVIADEAHRSQYDFIDGFAKHMRDALPNASFIGFTGTPIEVTDKNTRAVFGDYISVYDIQRAVEDKATVPIYYESRLAKLGLNDAEKPTLDPEFEDVTEGEEIARKEKLKSRWAQLEALVGTEKRIRLIAADLVDHFEKRLAAMDGKAMVVCMSRRICMELHDAIRALRPAWYSADDEKGALKVVMTGNAAEGPRVAEHARNKSRREALAKRFRNPADPFRIVIVRDMWLTGFDAPSLHTMYLDKPMTGHGLMQAIARVNRVFKDKPGGLVVDYLGLGDELKKALATYTQSGGHGSTAVPQDDAVAAMLKQYEICRGLFHGFDWSLWKTGTPPQRVSLLPRAQEHILQQQDGKARLMQAVHDLTRAFALAVPHDSALRIQDDVGFFQAVRAVLAKAGTGERKTDEELDHAVRQIVSRAITTEGVVDIFTAAGLARPDISILSEEFLAEVRSMPLKNVAFDLLRKLLDGEIRLRRRRNVVQARSFAAMLEEAMRKYQNRALETTRIIEELIELARVMREATARGESLGLTEDELAFYDALETNDSAVKVLGEPTLRDIARELVDTVRKNTTIDWTLRENVRARLRVMVKRILRKHGYPPDKQEKATETVLEQAAVLSEGWAQGI
jgi:type I restriction enzyme R subunit